jgi:hypothetical protein
MRFYLHLSIPNPTLWLSIHMANTIFPGRFVYVRVADRTLHGQLPIASSGAAETLSKPSDGQAEQEILIQSFTETIHPKLFADDVPLLTNVPLLNRSVSKIQ